MAAERSQIFIQARAGSCSNQVERRLTQLAAGESERIRRRLEYPFVVASTVGRQLNQFCLDELQG